MGKGIGRTGILRVGLCPLAGRLLRGGQHPSALLWSRTRNQNPQATVPMKLRGMTELRSTIVLDSPVCTLMLDSGCALPGPVPCWEAWRRHCRRRRRAWGDCGSRGRQLRCSRSREPRISRLVDCVGNGTLGAELGFLGLVVDKRH